MLYSFLLCIARFLMWSVFHVRFHHRERFMSEGACIIVGNHLSGWDPVAVACGNYKRHLCFMGKEELFRNRLACWFLTTIGGFPIKRGTADITAIRKALTLLKSGKGMVIFPEGTRIDGDEMKEAQQGAAMLALRSGAVLIPIAIFGHIRIFGHTDIVVGHPIDMQPFREGKGDVQGLTQAILQRIQQMQKEGIPQ